MKVKYKYYLFGSLFIVLYSLSFILAEKILIYIINKLKNLGFEIITINPLESINIVLKLSIYITFSILTPFLIIIGYEWIKDALYKKEKAIIKGFFKWSFISIIGGVCGLLITYFVIAPFLLNYNKRVGLPNTVSLEQLILLFVTNFLIMSIIFLMPILFKLLNKLNIIFKDTLIKNRKVFYIVSIIIIAIVTPTTDAISLIIMFIPFVFIYETSVLLLKNKTNNPI